MIPELRSWVVCEGQVGLIECLHSSNVLPVAVVKVSLDVHAHVLRTRDDLAAKVIRLSHSEPVMDSYCSSYCARKPCGQRLPLRVPIDIKPRHDKGCAKVPLGND